MSGVPESLNNEERSGHIADQPGLDGSRYYTVQRVNGNGANGKCDATAGPHKHTLEESDRIKKSSVGRFFLKEEKVKRKTQVSSCGFQNQVSVIAIKLNSELHLRVIYS